MTSGGWRLRLAPGVRRTEGGRVLIGGAPLRVLRLSERGRRWLDAVEADDDVPTDEGSQRLARRLVDGGLADPVPPTGAGPTADQVAVVIPVRDDADALSPTLARLGPVNDVVVVDDGSADPVAVTAAGDGGTPVRVFRHVRPLGPAVARNTGWRATRAPFVLFIDADVHLPIGWLHGVAGHLADPTVAAVAPRIQARADRAPTWLASYEADRSPLDLGAAPAGVRPGTRVPYVPTAALLVRREALEAVDGFDPDLRVGEDVDVVWRFDRAGWRVRYEPGVVATHPTRRTPRAWLRQRVAYGSSAAALAERHGDVIAPLRGLSGWSALAWGAVLAGHPIAGTAIAAASTTALAPKLKGLDDPAREAVRIAGRGHLWAARTVAEALRRTWWPLALALGFVHRRSRPALLAAFVVPPLLDRNPRSGSLGPVRYLGLRWADDVAYGAGVWLGCGRARSPRALLPSFSGPLDPPTDEDPGRPVPPVRRVVRRRPVRPGP